MSLSDTDILELNDRYTFLIKEYTKLAIEIAPLLDRFGKYKKELELITVEFVKRGFNPKNPEGLEKMIQDELDKRGIKVEDGRKP